MSWACCSALSLTQEQVAEASGRSRNFVAELEGGRRGASFEGVLAVVQALDVPMEEFGRVLDGRLAEQVDGSS